MTNTNQQTHRQPSPAYSQGYWDARYGKPESTQVAPEQLSEYREGLASGRIVNQRTGSTIKGGAQ